MKGQNGAVGRLKNLARQNIRLAKRLDAGRSPSALNRLRDLTLHFGFSLAAGEILHMNGGWYVTHAALLRLAARKRCAGIRVEHVDQSSDPLAGRWVFKATVFKRPSSIGFVGYGDADPSNTSPVVRGAEMRVAETRAVNRALRKAYGIGLCSVEELGSNSFPQEPTNGTRSHAVPSNGNGSANCQPRLRDKLCLLIRKYDLDPNLVKRYAADFCGTESLRDAGRDLVEAFVSTVAEEAAKDRAALLCKLNSYSQPEEVRS
jgi:hypothetical protein